VPELRITFAMYNTYMQLARHVVEVHGEGVLRTRLGFEFK
jgi:hypothetical protein